MTSEEQSQEESAEQPPEEHTERDNSEYEVPQPPMQMRGRGGGMLGSKLPVKIQDVPYLLEKAISDERIEDVGQTKEQMLNYLATQRISDYHRKLVPFIIRNFDQHKHTMDALDDILLKRKYLYKRKKLAKAYTNIERLFDNYNEIIVQLAEINEAVRVQNANMAEKIMTLEQTAMDYEEPDGGEEDLHADEELYNDREKKDEDIDDDEPEPKKTKKTKSKKK